MARSFVVSRSQKRVNSPPAGWLRGDRKFETELYRLQQSWQFRAYRRKAAALALGFDSLCLRTWSIWNIRRAMAAFLVTGTVLAGMIATVLIDYRVQLRTLRRLLLDHSDPRGRV